MTAIPVNKAMDKKRIIKKQRVEEERHKGSLTQKKTLAFEQFT
jgi:hypothetical protein